MERKVVPPNHMKVSNKNDTLRYLKYGSYILNNPEYKELVVMGSGSSIETAVKVAE